MNVTESKHKPVETPSTPPAEKKEPEPPTKRENRLLDAVAPTSKPTAHETANILEFYKQAMQPTHPVTPMARPVIAKPVAAPMANPGAKLLAALPPNPPNAKALYEAAKLPSPNASVGPIAHKEGNPNTRASEKDCKMGAELAGEIPIIGKPLKNELEELCKPAEPALAPPLANVPITATKGTALGRDDSK